MPATASTVNLTGFRSWFTDTRYLLLDKIDDMMKDPIFDLLGQIKDPSKADTISVTGRENTRTGLTKAEGAKVQPKAPVEEDQLHQSYITFESSMRITWESLQHDQYRFAEEDPAEHVENVFRGVSRLLHAQLFNYSKSTSVNFPGTASAYTLSLPNGQALFSSSQSGPGYSGKSNLESSGADGTARLSIPNLTQNIQTGINNFVYSTGERSMYKPNAILVPSNQLMLEKGKQITGSDKVESSRNNAINVYSGGAMKLIELKYAPEDPQANHAYDTTKQYWWMTADLEALRKSIQYKFIARPQILTKFLDPENGDSYITILARLAVVPKRWQFGVLSDSTTAPVTSA